MLQVAWSALHGTDGRVQVYRVSDAADPPGGTFTLAFDGKTSPPLPWNASAIAVEAALESLPAVGDVTVRGYAGAAANNSPSTVATWLVEFTTLGTPSNVGDIPLLEADGSFLTGTAVRVEVEEVSAGCCAVDVSANGGADYTSVSGSEVSRSAFRYQDRAVVNTVTPNAGPTSGGTPIVVSGTGFDLPTTVAGFDFVCVFGGHIESHAVKVNSTAAICTSPAVPRLEQGAMSVALRWPGSVDLSSTTAVFTYFEDVTLEELIPRRGSNDGGYAIAVTIGRGSFEAKGINPTCITEIRLPSNTTSGYTSHEVAASASAFSKAPGWISTLEETEQRVLNKEVYVCDIPGLDEIHPEINIDGWLDRDWGALALISLSGNGGVNVTGPLIFTYAPMPTVLAVEPRLGVTGGGTSVIVHGARFRPPQGGYDANELLCRFGHTTTTPARYISDSAVECTSPPHTNVPAVMSVAVESAFVFHEKQEVLLRIPSPMGTPPNGTALSPLSVSGTWTLSLEDFETDPMEANVTAGDMSFALSALPNIGNATVTADSRSVSDPYAGLSWNETAFDVYFSTRSGDIPMLSADQSDLRLNYFGDTVAGESESAEDARGLPVLTPEVLIRVVEEGHGGNGSVREVQMLKTNRSGLLAEVQAVTVATHGSPAAEVRNITAHSRNQSHSVKRVVRCVQVETTPYTGHSKSNRATRDIYPPPSNRVIVSYAYPAAFFGEFSAISTPFQYHVLDLVVYTVDP